MSTRSIDSRSSSSGEARVTAHLALADRVLSAADTLNAGLASEGPLPTRRDMRLIAEELLEVVFPEAHRLGVHGGQLREHVAATIATMSERLETAIYLGLHRYCGQAATAAATAAAALTAGATAVGAASPGEAAQPAAAPAEAKVDTCRERAQGITARLLEALPDLRATLGRDVRAAFESDPAASGVDEIVACYPGVYGIAIYRVAHRLLLDGAEVVPRMLTEHAHSRTGIDIHPGATIGEPFFIDHGTGIVVGETSVIGNRVRIYQGVTLGALSVRDRGRTDKPNPKKRHPTIEDDVIIYANATILGGDTVIGRGAVVGGNAWITYSVPPGIRVGVGT
jgi:serine O-acetyltransferase